MEEGAQCTSRRRSGDHLKRAHDDEASVRAFVRVCVCVCVDGSTYTRSVCTIHNYKSRCVYRTITQYVQSVEINCCKLPFSQWHHGIYMYLPSFHVIPFTSMYSVRIAWLAYIYTVHPMDNPALHSNGDCPENQINHNSRYLTVYCKTDFAWGGSQVVYGKPRRQVYQYITDYSASPCTSFLIHNFPNFLFLLVFAQHNIIAKLCTLCPLCLCPKSVRPSWTENVVFYIASIIHAQRFRMHGQRKTACHILSLPLTLYQPMTHICICVMSSHKPIIIYMGV